MSGKLLKKSPWRTMWLQPRQTIKSIVQSNSRLHFGPLSLIYGIPFLLYIAQLFSLGDKLPILWILIGSVVLGPILGMAVLSLSALLITWTGSWIGAKFKYLDVRAAVSWAKITDSVNLLAWIVLIGIFGRELFSQAFATEMPNNYQMGMLAIATLFQIALSIWSFILLLKGVSVVQGFSLWKSLLNLILAAGCLMVGGWILGIILWLI